MKKLQIKHPGEILKNDFLIPMGITVYKLSKAIGVSQSRTSNILKEKQGISADTALRLSKFFSTTSELWMNLQTAYELEKEWVKKGNEYKQIEPFKFAINPDFKHTKIKSQILKKFMEELTYPQRVFLLFAQIYEQGMEYGILLLSDNKINFDRFEWYDDIIKIPAYKNALTLEEKKLLVTLETSSFYREALDLYKEKNNRDKILTRGNKPTDELSEIVTKDFKGLKLTFKEVYYLDFEVDENTGVEGKNMAQFYTSSQVGRNLKALKNAYRIAKEKQ